MQDVNYGQVRLKIEEQMSAQGISINKLACRAEMQRTQLKAYMRNEVQRIDISILARLCYALDCQLEDIIEYQKPQK